MLEAILILVLVGIIWTISGVAIGGAQRAGMSVELLLFTSYFFGCSACLLLLGFYPPIGVEGPEAWYALGMYFSVGVLNVFSSIAMGKAMERGPNSLVWAILQSGMLVPFTVGIVFHGVKASPARLLGMGLMLLALVLISAKGKEKNSRDVKGRSWVFLSLLAFAICGLQQTINNEPSYSQSIRDGIPVIHRTLAIGSGIVLGSFLVILSKGASGIRGLLGRSMNRRLFWIYALGMQSAMLFEKLFLSFRGMDMLARMGMGAISYPIMVVSCIAGFSLYSIAFLHERPGWRSGLGLFFCAAGIVLLSFQ